MLKQLPLKYIERHWETCQNHMPVNNDELFPTENKLRPIPPLPNIANWFARVIHTRILKWCREMNIYVDDINLTIAICNYPSLNVLVD
jgi:hypothetical protein